MFCSVTRWRISRSMDEDQPLSGQARRHLEDCPACREFHRSCLVLHNRLARQATRLPGEAPAHLQDPSYLHDPAPSHDHDPAHLHDKVMAAWPAMLERERVPDKGLRLRPLFAAALVMLILGGSLFLFDKTTRLQPEPGYAMSRLEFMMGDDLPAAHLEQLSALAEAPLTEEMDCLKKDAAAMAAFLAGCLNRISSSLSSNPALK